MDKGLKYMELKPYDTTTKINYIDNRSIRRGGKPPWTLEISNYVWEFSTEVTSSGFLCGRPLVHGKHCNNLPTITVLILPFYSKLTIISTGC